jgi:arylsulfatase A-like enzyme
MAPNVILVSLDTLRADVAFSGRLPTIEWLRRQGTSCLRTVSSSPLTPVSHATVLSGDSFDNALAATTIGCPILSRSAAMGPGAASMTWSCQPPEPTPILTAVTTLSRSVEFYVRSV